MRQVRVRKTNTACSLSCLDPKLYPLHMYIQEEKKNMYKARSERDLCDGKNKALMRLMGRQWSKAEVGSEKDKRAHLGREMQKGE